MKVLKNVITFSSLGLGAFLFALASFNSINIDSNNFMKNDFNIKFAKRIDEIHGEVTIGRLAASVPKWKAAAKKKSAAKKNAVAEIDNKKVEEQIAAVESDVIPAPAVDKDLDLTFTGGLYNKQPLKDGKDYSGSAKVVDGVIEEIAVTFPDGKEFYVNTRNRMVGNVFEYEDSETREMKSALFFEVEKGTYMITLTDDTNFKGTRLEFKTDAKIELANSESNANWNLNEQNEVQAEEYAENDEEYTDARDFNDMADEYENAEVRPEEVEVDGFKFI